MDTERSDFDIAVIGAGLSGACAAILAAQSGARVVLLESGVAGRHKVCGEFLSPESRDQLEQLGVLNAMLTSGAREIGAARVLSSARASRAIAFARPGLSFSRRALDGLLWARAQETGALARDQTRVSRLEQSEAGGFVLEANGQTLRARFVIAATGRGSKWGRDGDEASPARTNHARNGAAPSSSNQAQDAATPSPSNHAQDAAASSIPPKREPKGAASSAIQENRAHQNAPFLPANGAGACSVEAKATNCTRNADVPAIDSTRASKNGASSRGTNRARNGRAERPRHEPATRFLGLKTHLRGARIEPGEVQMFPFAGGYCGLVEVEDGAFNTCLLIDYARSKGRSSSQIWDEVRRENCALAKATEGATLEFDWLATGNVSFDRFAPSRDGVLRVGDAAGYIHPLSGDGMAMALRSGELAARAVLHALQWDLSPDAAASSYARMWEREFGSRLRWAARLQPLFINPRFTRIAQGVCDFAPLLSKIAVRRTRGVTAF